MRSTLLLAVVFSCTSVFGFDEIPLPKQDVQLEVAHARAAGAGTKRGIIVKVLDRKFVPMTRKQIVQSLETSIVDGKEVQTPVDREVTVQYMTCEISGFREVTVLARDIKAQTVAGEAVPPAQLIRRLQAETPVMLSYSGAVDPYFLLTTKPDTLILSVEGNQIHPQNVEPATIAPTTPVE